MKFVLLGITAMVGLFAFTESLSCNTCSVSLIGICLNPSTKSCTNSTFLCTTGRASFTGVSGFVGFNYQGCLESSACNTTVTGTILGAAYAVTQSCCSTDGCNPVQISGASYVQFSLTAVLSAALLACVWGQSVY